MPMDSHERTALESRLAEFDARLRHLEQHTLAKMPQRLKIQIELMGELLGAIDKAESDRPVKGPRFSSSTTKWDA